MATTNERLQDIAIRHSLALAGYGRSLSDKIIRLLNSADADLVGKLAARLTTIEERGYDIGPRTTQRLNALLAEVRAVNEAIYTRLHEQLVGDLTEFASVEAAFQKGALDTALAVDVATKLPSPTMLRAIVETAPMEGRLLSSWTDGMAKGRMDRIEQAIRLGLVQGENTDKIVARIRGTKAARYSDGVLDVSRRSALAIVRTATTHVSNVAAQETWKANGNVVKGWQYMATLDGRTTVTCAALSGQVFPIGEGPIPPRHVNCRSISVAVTKSFRELGVDRDELSSAQRASMDGQVAGDTTFSDWLTKKGKATQDQILGPTRAKLWRDGKLSLQDLIKNDGTVLTLEELKKRHAAIM